MQAFLEIVLVIYGAIIGLMSAFSMSYENDVGKEEVNQLNQFFSMMGNRSLDDKKKTVKKVSKLSYVLYLIYSALAIFVFLDQILGLALAALLIIIQTIDYMLDRDKIKKAKTFNKIISPTRRSFMIYIVHIVIVGIHIGLLL